MNLYFSRCNNRHSSRKNLRSGGRRRSAYSILEVLLSMGLMSVVVMMVTDILLHVTRVTGYLGATETAVSHSRANLDRVARDLMAADLVLTAYVGKDAAGSAKTYQTNASDTLCLRIPTTTAAGATVSGQWDYVVYFLATPANSNDGPYTLNELVVPGTSSWRSALGAGTILAKNVSSAALSYVATEPLSGSGCSPITGGCQITLKASAFASGSGTTLVKEAVLNGVNLCSTAQATFSNKTLTLTTTPLSADTVDAHYAVDGTLDVNGGGNAASEVTVTLHLQGVPGSAMTLSSQVPSTTITTTAVLRNRAPLF